MPDQTTTWVSVSRQAINHNIRQFKSILSPKTDLMAVVKSNAYGHGLIGVARIAQSAGARWLGTVSLDEAVNLRQAGIKCRILVLSFFNPAKLDIAIKKNITLTVYNISSAYSLNRLAKKLHKTIPIHLKIDTGTTRLGFLPSETLAAAKIIKNLSNLRLEGVFSHLADAENPNQISANRQISLFNKIISQLDRHGIHIQYPHIACSAATILSKNSRFKLARIGISLYGLWSIENSSPRQVRLKLEPALSWYTRVLQVKTVPKGTRIGYGGTYRARKTMTLAILPIGYWDGYDRKLSNNSDVLIHGHRCAVRGRICMNLTMVDVTNVSKVRPGDKVTLIGKDGDQNVTVDELAKRIGTINYEVVTRINPQIARIYY